MSILKTSLEKIVNWLRVNYPDAASALRPGLTNGEIATLTQDITFSSVNLKSKLNKIMQLIPTEFLIIE